ncbi:MAG: HAD family hydrolase [Kiritimatiellales bacterium]|nr:HAD family hydrolase [Kiritimatiellales bacterium]MCF7864232.1 HAD family hydrolase [Kiritimatiellales bacterium]
MACRHIVWDWNGTLWDDTWLCVEINNHMLQRRGLAGITPEIYRDRLCFPVTDYYSQIGFDYEKDPYKTLAEEFIEEYERRRFECALQPGARELIQSLQDRKIPQAVLSAYQHDTLLQAVDHFGLTDFFADIIGLDDIYAAGKVENGRKYIAGLDLAPENVLFIGDTIHDFDVAQAMGVDCVLVANGHNSRSRLEECGVPVFDSIDEMKKFVVAPSGG